MDSVFLIDVLGVVHWHSEATIMVDFIKEFALQQKKRITTIVKEKKSSTPDGGKNKDHATQYSDAAKQTMKQWLSDLSKGGVHQLRLDYNELKSFAPQGCTQTAFEANKNKCRYKDVKCFDKTRVVLKWPSGEANDFIHANWVKHELLENEFICCQAPLESTVGDFWRMVWQEKVKQIIMLCNLAELGKTKCCQYWPPKVGDKMTHFTLTITCVLVDTSDPSFVHTKLDITCGEQVRHVDHRQWISWPDKSVPKTPMAPFRLLQYPRHFVKNPSIVHCSAGVGRTGTFVLIEIAANALKRGIMPDMKQYFKDVRSQRSQAIQTEDQYLYIHYAIVQLLFIKGVVSAHDVRAFCAEYVDYLKLLNENGGKQLPLDKTAPPKVDLASSDGADIAAILLNEEKNSDSTSAKNRKKKKKKASTATAMELNEDNNEEGGSIRRKKKDAKGNKDVGEDKRSDLSSKRSNKAADSSSKRARKAADTSSKRSIRRKKKEAIIKDDKVAMAIQRGSNEPVTATPQNTGIKTKPIQTARKITYAPPKVYTIVQAGTNTVTAYKCHPGTADFQTSGKVLVHEAIKSTNCANLIIPSQRPQK